MRERSGGSTAAGTRVEIPATEKKLREAEFFFGHMTRASGSSMRASEEFEFYFNAFVSAGRNVGYVLQKEQSALYDGWYDDWIKAIDGGKLRRWRADRASRHRHAARPRPRSVRDASADDNHRARGALWAHGGSSRVSQRRPSS